MQHDMNHVTLNKGLNLFRDRGAVTRNEWQRPALHSTSNKAPLTRKCLIDEKTQWFEKILVYV